MFVRVCFFFHRRDARAVRISTALVAVGCCSIDPRTTYTTQPPPKKAKTTGPLHSPSPRAGGGAAGERGVARGGLGGDDGLVDAGGEAEDAGAVRQNGGAPLPPALALSVCVEVVEWVCLGGVGVHAEGLEQVWLDDGRVDREGDA